jgi:hypothetical protein
MGADLCVEVLTWDPKRKLNWKAGKKYIKSLKYDEDGTTGDFGFTKDELLSHLETIREAAEERVRDSVVMRIAHLNVLLTGGMSWGDDPSNTYRSITNLNDIDGILDAVGFDKDELDYKGILEKILKCKAIRPLLLGVDKELDKMLDTKMRK